MVSSCRCLKENLDELRIERVCHEQVMSNPEVSLFSSFGTRGAPLVGVRGLGSWARRLKAVMAEAPYISPMLFTDNAAQLGPQVAVETSKTAVLDAEQVTSIANAVGMSR